MQTRKRPLSYAESEVHPLRKGTIRVLENISGRKLIQRLYDEIRDRPMDAGDIWKTCLEQLRIAPIFSKEALQAIPKEGPLVVIANHPYGVVDGLVLGFLLNEVRPDYKVIVNEVLCKQDPRMDKFLLPVDFSPRPEARQINLDSRKQAQDILSSGGAIGIFPGGGVATARPFWTKATEFPWKRFTAKLIQMNKAVVVPVYFPGQNSRIFQLASNIHPLLRLGILLHEVRNKMDTELEVRIGEPVPFNRLAPIKDREKLLTHLQQLVLSLSN